MFSLFQMVLRMTPAGCGTSTTCTDSGSGFDPLPGLGVFHHGICIPPARAEYAGQRQPYQGYALYGFWYGIRPLPVLGVFTHGMHLPRCLVGLALIRVTNLGIQLPILSSMQSDPPALAQGVLYPHPVLLECPVLCTACPLTGTIFHLPHRRSASSLRYESLP